MGLALVGCRQGRRPGRGRGQPLGGKEEKVRGSLPEVGSGASQGGQKGEHGERSLQNDRPREKRAQPQRVIGYRPRRKACPLHVLPETDYPWKQPMRTR